MSVTKRFVLTTIVILCLVPLTDSPPRGRWAAQMPARVAAEPSSLLDFVPAEALITVEVCDLDRRWDELRSISAIAGFQDEVFSCAGIEAELAHGLAGDGAVLFLAGSEDPPFVVPVAILRPVDLPAAERFLSGLGRLSLMRVGGLLWIGPAGAQRVLERLSRPGTARLDDVLPMDEVEARLPRGGLVRGWLNPVACVRLLHDPRVDSLPTLLRWAAGALSAELSAVRYAAFRRDLADGELVTDGIVAYDPVRLPQQLLRSLDAEAASAVRPVDLPENAVAAVAFRLDASACMPWLRNLAASDPRGPLRNLAFWLDEFQRRYRRDLDRDLFSALGEQGWLLALEVNGSGAPGLAAVIEIREEPAVVSTLRDLLSWAGEQLWIDTFGVILPIPWVDAGRGGVIYGTTLHAPFSEFPGPRFQVAGKYLILGDRRETLDAARAFAGTLGRQSGARSGASNAAVHGSVWVKGEEIARLLTAGLGVVMPDPDACLSAAASRMTAGLESLMGEWCYESDAVRLRGRLRFTAQRASPSAPGDAGDGIRMYPHSSPRGSPARPRS